MADPIEIIPLEPKSRGLRRRKTVMPQKFSPLATYNTERSRGIMHTPEWDAEMAGLQREFDQWQQRTA